MIWPFTPSVKTWLKLAFKYIVQMIGTPQAEFLFVGIIAAAIGIPPAQAQILWNVITKLAQAANEAHQEPGSGDLKYAMVSKEFTEIHPDVGTFEFDYILHLVLGQMKANKRRLQAQGKI